MKRFASVMDPTRSALPYPEGIGDTHVPDRRSLGHRASWFSIAVLALLMAVASTGLLGGWKRPLRTAETADARLDVRMPKIIRNGEFLETEIKILPKRDFADLTLAVEPALWHDLTINTFIPGAAEESFSRNAYRFSYGPAKAGQPLTIKIDAQINPSTTGGTSGAMSIADGDAEVVRLPLAMRVLP